MHRGQRPLPGLYRQLENGLLSARAGRNVPIAPFWLDLAAWTSDIPERESSMTHTIQTADQLGALIRRERKAQGLRQPDLAAAAGTSVRLIVEVEGGKSTAQIGKVLDVLRQLGLSVHIDGLSEG